ncbi:hypothetical protein [uncultured Gordonia sp.]|uniref:hypothetical protein n=1 Tax=uncultured Gordonia sp. TaxID=198437 RepID=UPI002628782D|nr:hypothetical protein [uncultured Gordonia sp.]
MSTPNVHVNVQTGTGEILRIVSTILLFGGAGVVAWRVAQGPNAEMAASGFTMMLVMMVRLMYARGLVALPSGNGDGFKTTKSTVAQIGAEYRQWLAGTSMPAMAAIAAGYAVAFLVMRAGIAAALGAFQNVYIAGGTAAMVGAIVVFPSLLPNMIAGMRRKGVVTTPPATTPAPAAPVAPQPAPAPAAEPAPTPKRVVRRVVKKESTTDV